MTKFIHQRPQARAIARRARGRHPKEPDDPRQASAVAEEPTTEPPDEGPLGVGTKPAARPAEPEVYRPKSGVGSYSLTGASRETATGPLDTVYKPPVARDLLPELSDELLAYLRQHLDAGETHYPPRPGMPDLRQRVALELSQVGASDIEPDGVVITAGEGEALFATLMGCELGAGDQVRVSGDWQRHSEVFDIFEVEPVPPGDVGDTSPTDDSALLVLFLGKAIPPASNGGSLPLPTGPHVIYIGSFDALPEMASFRLGYVAGPAERIARIMTWKQAFSICCAAPSQRAALFGFTGLGSGRPSGSTA